MIGEKLKEIREATGMNKKEFAQYLNLKYTTYNNYETEAREPASDFLIMISEKFDVSIDYLLGLKTDKNIMHSYQLKTSEYNYIKKYRLLDPHGKEMVDFTLDKEYERSKALREAEDNIIEINSHLEANAANARTDIDIPEGTDTSENDIMDDEKLQFTPRPDK